MNFFGVLSVLVGLGFDVSEVAARGLYLPINYFTTISPLDRVGIMHKKKSDGKLAPMDGVYFHLLGLRPGESDPSTIRSAASAMSGSIGDCEGQHCIEGLIQRRSEIALATYRLLDPRRRESFLERVQLCYPVNHEERKTEIRQLDFKKTSHDNPWVEPRTTPDAPAIRPELMNRPVIDRAIREDAENPIASQAVSDKMSWLDERREVIRSLRETNSSASSSSPISWIRSVLGW
jgi:hypothetical protein